MSNGTLDLLPHEFREGMAARASILGDVRCNHPTNWSLPERNWPEPPRDERERVELSTVHAIVQYTCKGPSDGWQDLASAKHPLREAVGQFHNELAGKGVQILSVQCMQRFLGPDSEHSRDHFGFVDGISQPWLEALQKKPAGSDEVMTGGVGYKNSPGDRPPRDKVVTGDLLLGYKNSFGDPPLTGKLWDDSTFLVIRKLEQHVDALDAVLKESGDEEGTKAKFMGRKGDGEFLTEDETINTKGNDFDYSKDLMGKVCPLQSHIRRANPRSTRDDIHTVPRIMRRGMSYGPRPDGKNSKDKRGLFFMAYNASIAEQFEVIQAWLSGSNSSNPNSYSALRDPFLGVPQDGDPHSFVFYDKNGDQKVVKLPPDKPIVTLEWGLYAFVPSIKAVDELKELAKVTAKISPLGTRMIRRRKTGAPRS